MMLEVAGRLDLPPDEARSLVEYPFRILVDNFLMSGAFHGCGSGIVQEWLADEFYAGLLSGRPLSAIDTAHKRIEPAYYFVGLVAQLFERLQLQRLRLGIGAALSYYGPDDAIRKAKNNLIRWLQLQEAEPLLLDLVLGGYLVPQDGLLLPGEEKIRKALETPETWHRSPFGAVKLSRPLLGLVCLLKGRSRTGDEVTDAFLWYYLRWHEHLGLITELQKRLDEYPI